MPKVTQSPNISSPERFNNQQMKLSLGMLRPAAVTARNDCRNFSMKPHATSIVRLSSKSSSCGTGFCCRLLWVIIEARLSVAPPPPGRRRLTASVSRLGSALSATDPTTRYTALQFTAAETACKTSWLRLRPFLAMFTAAAASRQLGLVATHERSHAARGRAPQPARLWQAGRRSEERRSPAVTGGSRRLPAAAAGRRPATVCAAAAGE